MSSKIPFLQKLYLKNLYQFTDEEINFQPGITLITGKNGVGKSLLLDIIRLGLNLGARKTRFKDYRGYIQDASKPAEIDLTLYNPKTTKTTRFLHSSSEEFNNEFLNQDFIILKRVLTQKQTEIQIQNKAKKMEKLTGDSTRFLDQALKNIGITPEDEVAFVPGEEFMDFITATPNKRFKTFVEKIGLESLKMEFDELQKKINDKMEKKEAKINELNALNLKFNNILDKKYENAIKIIELEKNIKSLEEEKDWSSFTSLKNQIEQLKKEIKDLEEERDQKSAEIEELQKNKDEEKANLEELKRSFKINEGKKEEAKTKLDENRGEINSSKERKEKIIQDIAKINRDNEKFNLLVKELEKDKQRTEKKVIDDSSKKILLDKLNEKGKQKELNNERLKKLQKLKEKNEEFIKLSAEIKNDEKILNSFKDNLKSKLELKKSFQNQIDEINSVLSKEAELKQAFLKDKELSKTIESKKNELNKIEVRKKDLENLKRELSKKEEELVKEKSKVQELPNIESLEKKLSNKNLEREELFAKKGKLLSDIKTAELNLKNSKGGNCPLLDQPCKNIDGESLEDHFKKEIKELKPQLVEIEEKINISNKEIIDIETEIKSSRNIKSQIEKMQVVFAQKEKEILNIKDQINDFSKEIQKLQDVDDIVKQLEKEKSQLSDQIKLYNNMSITIKPHKDLTEKKEKINIDIQKLNSEINSYENKIKEKISKKNQFEEVLKDIDFSNINEEIEKYTIEAGALDTEINSIKKDITEGSVDAILSEILKKINDTLNKIRSNETKINEKETEIKELDKILSDKSKDIQILENNFNIAKEAFDNINTEKITLEKKIQKLEYDISGFENSISKIDEDLKKKNSTLQEKEKQILSYNKFKDKKNPFEKIRSAGALKELIEDRQRQKEVILKIINPETPDTIIKEYNEKTKIRDDYKKDIEQYEKDIIALQNEFPKLEQNWKDIFQKKKVLVQKYFKEILNSINADGELIFENETNMEEGKLSIQVKFGSESIRNIDQHSSGQKQAAIIAFVFALQSLSLSPITSIDEFDKGLDPINKIKLLEIIPKIVAKLIDLAEDIPKDLGKQYILVCPDVIANVSEDISLITIIKQGIESSVKITQV